MLPVYWWDCLTCLILKWKLHACKSFSILVFCHLLIASQSVQLCVLGLCGTEELNYYWYFIRWKEEKKNHTSNGLKRDETQWICAKQNNKDKEIWLEIGHPNFLPALSFLVCHLASLLQPFDLGFYVLWCGREERHYLDAFTHLVCVLKPLMETPNSSSVWGNHCWRFKSRFLVLWRKRIVEH